MIKKILWISVMGCVMLLPFLTADAFKEGVYLLYTIFSVILLCLAISEKVYTKKPRIIIPLFSWLFIILFTSIYAVYPQAAFESMGNIFFCALIFVVLSGLDSRRKRQIAVMLIIGSFFISMRAILQYFFFFDKILPSLALQRLVITEREFFYISEIVQRHRVVATFVTPNLLAAYLVMINLIIISFCLIQKNGFLSFILVLLFVMNSYALWLTRSLAGLASLAFGISLFIILVSVKNRPDKVWFKGLLIFASTGILALFAALFVKRFIYDSGADNLFLSLRGRLEFWSTALRMIADRPLKFTGFGGFGNFYRIYAPHARIESMMAHNIIMQLWIETGLYGLLAFIWFVSVLLYNGFNNLLQKRACFEACVFQAGVLSAVLAFLLHNMLDFSFFVAQAAIVWWILCAFTLNDS